MDIAAPLPPPLPRLPFVRAAIRFINHEVGKARILGLSNGLRNLEIGVPGPVGLWEELAEGFARKAAAEALEGVVPR